MGATGHGGVAPTASNPAVNMRGAPDGVDPPSTRVAPPTADRIRPHRARLLLSRRFRRHPFWPARPRCRMTSQPEPPAAASGSPPRAPRYPSAATACGTGGATAADCRIESDGSDLGRCWSWVSPVPLVSRRRANVSTTQAMEHLFDVGAVGTFGKAGAGTTENRRARRPDRLRRTRHTARPYRARAARSSSRPPNQHAIEVRDRPRAAVRRGRAAPPAPEKVRRSMSVGSSLTVSRTARAALSRSRASRASARAKAASRRRVPAGKRRSCSSRSFSAHRGS